MHVISFVFGNNSRVPQPHSYEMVTPHDERKRNEQLRVYGMLGNPMSREYKSSSGSQ